MIGVVLYHIGLGFPGGYVGVDVFFVISGYLITGIIVKDLYNGTFSMLDFWVRRIRRILPAVIVTVVASLVIGYLLLPSFEGLAKSSIATTLMVSNMYFWRSPGYFDAASDMQPLLHTWSLAIEEQFYVIFPLILLILFRYINKHTFSVVCLVAGGSLALSCWALVYKPQSCFYLLPTRAWELMAGAGIALMSQPKKTSRIVDEVCACLGVMMIVATMTFYDALTPFPGWMAIPPVAGSAIFIWANLNRQTYAGKLLSMRPLVFIGLVSYSFYLWHWPILVFLKHIVIDVNLAWKMAVLIGSMLLSVLSWKYVETPFRRKGVLSKRSSAFAFAALSSVAVLLMITILDKKRVKADRFNDGLTMLRTDLTRADYQDNETIFIVSDLNEDVAEKMPIFFVWGDSHADMLLHTIGRSARRHGLRGLAHMSHKLPVTGLMRRWKSDDIAHNKDMLRLVINSGTKNLILIARWSLYIDGDPSTEKPNAFYSEGLMKKNDNESEIHLSRSVDLLAEHLEMMARQLQSHGVTIWLIEQIPESNNVLHAHHFYMANKYSHLNSMPEQYTISERDHNQRQANV
ncbi:MAG: acyltransferase family protein, partial [Akkermansiaceae bacterium]|nr:acyltransferase family protein [Akkermansiaceae bacterium]